VVEEPVSAHVSGASVTASGFGRTHAIGLALAGLAGVHQAVIASTPTNDDFMHLTLADQVLAGDWPLRDFFDPYGPLMYGFSAIGRLLFGHRLLSEAVIVAVALGVSVFLVFRLVRVLTGSTVAAALSAVLLILASVRGYSYPKVLIFAVAAALWWAYVREPSRLKSLALGAWVAAAFYWRADHGVYVAVGVALAVVTAHGVSRLAAIRLAQAAAVSLIAVVPWLVLASATVGLTSYVRDGAAIAAAQHATTSSHTWPKWAVRRPADVIRLAGREEFAPTVSVRWAEDSSSDARAAVLAKYGLTPVSNDGPLAQVVRMSDPSSPTVRALINEPIVADTAGIDRGRSEVPPSAWPAWQRARFSQWWLRFQFFTGVNEHTNAGEAVAALFYALPLIVVVAAVPWLQRHLAAGATGVRLAGFGLFGIVTAFGLMRSPYDVRAVDDVVVSAILFGCIVAGLWRAAIAARGLRRALLAVASVMFAVLVMKSVAVAGEFEDRAAWLAGQGQSVARMQGAWSDVRDRLLADPPLTYWKGMPGSVELQLAQYAAECLPSTKRLLVLWFAPEIYYHADRLMAARHLVYEASYQGLAHEQALTLDKIQRYEPPMVFESGDLDTDVRAQFPALVDYVHREYSPAGALEDNGRRFRIFLRKTEAAAKSYGDQAWPCLS
jgi:4-amino-4-deoxy-L-arabinose transferase-like glycosyltransferase